MSQERNPELWMPTVEEAIKESETENKEGKIKTRQGSGYLKQLYSTARTTAGTTHTNLKSLTTFMVNFIPTANVDASELQVRTHFDDAEIAAALVRAVEVYNDSLPPTSTLDTSTFPFGGLWLDGARAALFESAADWYARNQLAAAAGGVQVDDMAKAPYYLQQSDKLWASYKAAVKARKVSENARTGGRYIGSPYGYIGGPTSRS
jgi:hypothetical protein